MLEHMNLAHSITPRDSDFSTVAPRNILSYVPGDCNQFGWSESTFGDVFDICFDSMSLHHPDSSIY